MPASMTALTVLAAPSTPGGQAFDEQASDQDPGNKFACAPGTRLYARNTTAGAINLVFEADLYGAEVDLLTVAIPGSGTENGVKILGPFPPEFLQHGTTEAASNGSVFVRQASGSDGEIVLCPFQNNPNLER